MALAEWIVRRPSAARPAGMSTSGGAPPRAPTACSCERAVRDASVCSTPCTGRSGSAPARAGCGLAPARAAGRARRLLRRDRGLGAGQLVRPEPGCDREYDYSYGRPSWFEHSAAEHRAVRERAWPVRLVLVRQATWSRAVTPKPCCSGCAPTTSRCRRAAIVYTQWLNERGGIEADLTVTRLARTGSWSDRPRARSARLPLAAAAHRGRRVRASSPTSPRACRARGHGPASARLLQPLSRRRSVERRVPVRHVPRDRARLRARPGARASPTSASSAASSMWPTEFAGPVLDTGPGDDRRSDHARGLPRAGLAAHGEGATAAGATTSATPTRPLEAGLGFAVAWDKPGGFIGREALLGPPGRVARPNASCSSRWRTRAAPLPRRADRTGTAPGRARSPRAPTATRWAWAVALGYVTAPAPGTERSWYTSGTYEVEIACERVPAQASLRPFYDPASGRPRS